MSSNNEDFSKEHIEILNQILEMLKKQAAERETLWWRNDHLSKYLDVSIRTLQTWRDKKLIKYSQVRGKIWYKDEWVQEFLEKHKKP